MAQTESAAIPRLIPKSEDMLFWRSGASGALHLYKDRQTGRWIPPFAPEAVAGPQTVAEPVSGRGRVFTFTVNHHAYNPAVPPPYVIALVVLDEQEDLRIPTNIVNCAPEAVRIGMPVKVVFEKTGENYVPVFEPAE